MSDATPRSTELELFSPDGGQIRIVMEDGVAYFVASDVCSAITLSDVGKALERVDQQDKTQILVTASDGRRRMVWAVSESGLYELIIRSDKAEARAFRRWITSEVLPSIRKTGTFVARTLDPLDALQAMVDQLREQKTAIRGLEEGSRDHDARLAAIEGRHDWYSGLGYARLHGLPTSHIWLQRLGATAGRIGRRAGLEVQKVQHSLFGEVNSWPEWVWAAAVEARKDESLED